MRVLFLFAGVMLAGAGCCGGQARASFPVRGEIQHDREDRVNDLWVGLHDLSRHMATEKVPVLPDGSFELSQVETGSYELRLVDQAGNGIRSETFLKR